MNPFDKAVGNRSWLRQLLGMIPQESPEAGNPLDAMSFPQFGSGSIPPWDRAQQPGFDPAAMQDMSQPPQFGQMAGLPPQFAGPQQQPSMPGLPQGPQDYMLGVSPQFGGQGPGMQPPTMSGMPQQSPAPQQQPSPPQSNFHPLLADLQNTNSAMAGIDPEEIKRAFHSLSSSGAPIQDPAGAAAGQARINAPAMSELSKFILENSGTTSLGGAFGQEAAPPAMSPLESQQALTGAMADHRFGGNTVARQDAQGRAYFASPDAVGGSAGNDRVTMTPEQAMARLEARAPGSYYEGHGYAPNSVVTPKNEQGQPTFIGDEALRRKAQGGIDTSMFTAAQKERAGRNVSAREAELARRRAGVQERGMSKVRGGYLPAGGAESLALLEVARTNPEAVARLMGQRQQTEAEWYQAQLSFLQSQQEVAARGPQVQDALRSSNFRELVAAGVPPEDAIRFSIESMGGQMPQGASSPQSAPATAESLGLVFTPKDDEQLASLAAQPGGGRNIVDYGRSQGWSDEKIQRALRKATGSQWATPSEPSGWNNWLQHGFGLFPEAEKVGGAAWRAQRNWQPTST